MSTLFERFEKLIKLLSDLTEEIEWSEDFQVISVKFEGKVGHFIKVFSMQEFVDELDKDDLSVETFIGKHPLLNGKLLEVFEFGLINEDETATVTIQLNKQKSFGLDNNTIFFFRLKAFLSKWYFSNKQLISFFDKMDKSKYIFVYLPIQESLKNEYLILKPLSEYSSHSLLNLSKKSIEKLKRIVGNRDDLTRVHAVFPIPPVFKLDLSNEEIQSVFNRNLFFLCLLHLANKYNENNTFIFRGQKTIELKWVDDYHPFNTHILYRIFEFSYGENQTEDKLEITRNIFTIYLHNESLEKLDTELERMEKTIKRHFSLYVNDKIKKFFDGTKSAVEEAHKYAEEARNAADKIVSNINTSILGLITAVFSGAVIMSRGSKILLLLALGLHVIYFILAYLFNAHFARKKKKDILDVYEASTKYFSNIEEGEKKEIKETYVVPAMERIDKNLKIYKWLTIILSIVIFISIIGASKIPDKYFGDYEKQTNSIEQRQK